MQSLQELLYEKGAGIAYVTVNRPQAMNALSHKAIDELRLVIEDARSAALPSVGEIMSNEILKAELIRGARAFFDHLLTRLQALDAEHASSQQHRQHVVGDTPNRPRDTSGSLRLVESDALKLYLASASALLKASEALIDTRSGIPTPNRAARLTDLVDQTKEACRIAYRAALLITDS